MGPEECSVELSNLRLAVSVGHILGLSLILPAAVGDSASSLFFSLIHVLNWGGIHIT